MSTGIEMIAAERKRQVEEEGWTPEHDAQHQHHELADAASGYAMYAWAGELGELADPPRVWPWDRTWWKPASPIRMLVKAGALIAAEIDRRLARGEKP